MVSNKLCYFLRLSWIFFGFSYLLNKELTHKDNSYVCVMWFCDCFVCVTLNVWSFLNLRSASNFIKILLTAKIRVTFFTKFNFWGFLLTFSFFWGTCPNFCSEIHVNVNKSNVHEFHSHSKAISLSDGSF